MDMTDEQMFCAHCGKQQSTGNKFCVACGNELHRARSQQNAPIQIYNTFGAGNTTPLVVPRQEFEGCQNSSILATLALVFGILGLVLSWTAWFGMILSAGGIGCGCAEVKSGKGMSGIITGTIGFVLGLLFLLIYAEIPD